MIFVLYVSLLRLLWEVGILWAVFLEDLQNWKAPEWRMRKGQGFKGLHPPVSAKDVLASPKKKKKFFTVGDQTLVQAAQRGGGLLSVFVDIQSSAGQSPEKSALPLKATLAQSGAGKGTFGVLSSHNSSVMPAKLFYVISVMWEKFLDSVFNQLVLMIEGTYLHWENTWCQGWNFVVFNLKHPHLGVHHSVYTYSCCHQSPPMITEEV